MHGHNSAMQRENPSRSTGEPEHRGADRSAWPSPHGVAKRRAPSRRRADKSWDRFRAFWFLRGHFQRGEMLLFGFSLSPDCGAPRPPKAERSGTFDRKGGLGGIEGRWNGGGIEGDRRGDRRGDR